MVEGQSQQATLDQTDNIPINKTLKKKPGKGEFAGPGPGRPKGVQNKKTLEQRLVT